MSKFKNYNAVMDYAKNIDSGKKPACNMHKLAAQRFLKRS